MESLESSFYTYKENKAPSFLCSWLIIAVEV